LTAICLLVAGALRATLPGPEFTLAWEHSVEKIRWDERYRLEGQSLTLIEARVEGSGAGMEAPAGAELRDGRWSWQPNSTHAELRLTRSTYAADYTLCSAGQCASLGTWTGATAQGAVVTVRPCGSTGGKEVGR
jgi:hypothetical protein